MTDIKPIDVDGEPICAGRLCKSFIVCNNVDLDHLGGHLCGMTGGTVLYGDPCIPGLRKQRDELQEKVSLMEPVCILDALRRGDFKEVSILPCGHRADEHCDCKWAKG